MKDFIVLVSTICLGLLIATFVLGFKENITTIKTTGVNALASANTAITDLNH